MTHGLVTIAVAGDGAEADSILRTLAGAGITARLEGAEGEIGGRRTTARAACSSTRSSSVRPRRRCWTRMRPTTSTDGDGGTPPAIFDRMAERYDDLRGPQEQLAEQFEFTIAAGPGRGDAPARRRLRHRSARGRCGRAPRRARLGRRRLRADAREGTGAPRAGAAFKLAQADDLPFRAGWFDAAHDASRRARARRPPRRRAGRGTPRAAAERAALRLDVRARALHGPPPGAVSARPARDRPRALPGRPEVLTRELTGGRLR